ncbi:MAG: methyltransferase [Myxococcota bacterium]
MENVLGRTRDDSGEDWVNRFANGLVVHTDAFLKADGARILPLGGPQDAILNHLVHFPEKVRDKRVFDPFSGSGIFGLMALQLDAAYVDFLDINPRARDFQRANAERNHFPADRFETHLQSIDSFEAAAPYDLVLANPPFVPIPPGIEGTLTSAAGPEGNDLVDLLLVKLDGLMASNAEALVYLMQFVSKQGPLVGPTISEHLRGRKSELTPAQVEPIAFDDYCEAYGKCFPDQAVEIEAWRSDLTGRHGQLGLQHYILHVSPGVGGESGWVITDNLVDKYGIAPHLPEANKELALGRVLENVVPRQS